MTPSELHFSDPEQDLWARFRAGDEDAYSSLMRVYSRLLFRYGCRLVADEDFVKDCIQDIFFDLWEHRSTVSQPASIKAYLFKAIRLRIFREQSKWIRGADLEDNFEVEFSIERQLIDRQLADETHRKLEQLLNALPKRQKEILYLRFYEGLSHDDISRIMTMNRQSVYNLLHESILRLRRSWQGEWVLSFLFLIREIFS
ncbi:RNA polymerase sigma factor [Siphonobacter aquaeclarae]|uniref:RNA polymerase sigma factor, sigma-70 family n=1 Tax=Siphonobacter aquaeclarae TaxID=563176 RepID=A0A1G9JU50_9BACT|nr:sigma-70 family RNA polymerase sigma factor [Siphonobacter aquaeclarae]MBO9637816.1 sigma-70 family RNA polymerase sigma factor [Siphonobacter aquaeclarae]SDL40423.1 RNA polymerase sigma factor, sigma-70 family [Siphonobacter aquaeclarae]